MLSIEKQTNETIREDNSFSLCGYSIRHERIAFRDARDLLLSVLHYEHPGQFSIPSRSSGQVASFV